MTGISSTSTCCCDSYAGGAVSGAGPIPLEGGYGMLMLGCAESTQCFRDNSAWNN